MILGVLGGASLWWFTLTFCVSLLRKKFRPRHLLWINRVTGAVIVVLGAVAILSIFYTNTSSPYMESFPPIKKKIIIAVDGFSSCGKSTFAREVAARIGYIFIDTGAMYRAVTLLGLRRGAIGPDGVDEKALTDLLSEADISFRFNPGRGSQRYLPGR